MKTGTSPPAAELPVVPENLCTLKQEQLVQQRQRIFGANPPDRLRRPLMIQALAYRLQEKACGGLKPTTRPARRILAHASRPREVTGERIRDKIAASKRKEMWMGGLVPLGYEVQDRQLVINPSEAETVRHIFQRYTELGNVRLLKEDLDRARIFQTEPPRWLRSRNGRKLANAYVSRIIRFAFLAPDIVEQIAAAVGRRSSPPESLLRRYNQPPLAWPEQRKMFAPLYA